MDGCYLIRKSLGPFWTTGEKDLATIPSAPSLCLHLAATGSLSQRPRREGSSLVLRLDTKSGSKVDCWRNEEPSCFPPRVFPSRECNLPSNTSGVSTQGRSLGDVTHCGRRGTRPRFRRRPATRSSVEPTPRRSKDQGKTDQGHPDECHY